jgi:hypothetical protein
LRCRSIGPAPVIEVVDDIERVGRGNIWAAIDWDEDRFDVFGWAHGKVSEEPIITLLHPEDFIDLLQGGHTARVADEGMCNEWEEWCEAQELPYISADEMEAEEGLSRKQREYVQSFIVRWNALQSCLRRSKS